MKKRVDNMKKRVDNMNKRVENTNRVDYRVHQKIR